RTRDLTLTPRFLDAFRRRLFCAFLCLIVRGHGGSYGLRPGIIESPLDSLRQCEQTRDDLESRVERFDEGRLRGRTAGPDADRPEDQSDGKADCEQEMGR